jgi:acetyl-CoA synthetase
LSRADASALDTDVKRATEPYKYPQRVGFVKELPKTISGKIRRTELRERERPHVRPARSTT